MTLVTDTASLAALCDRLSREPYVAVDTEFMRDKTYYAKLCLVQLAGAGEAAAVDTVAPGLDLAPLYELMANPAVLKVFHADRQDVEIFVHQADAVPAPPVAPQIAPVVFGLGDAVSYDRPGRHVHGGPLDQTPPFT